MAISAKLVSNFTKMNGTFRNNYIMIEVADADGKLKTKYARIGDLTLIQSNGITLNFDYEAPTREIRKSFENAAAALNRGEVQFQLNIGENVENITSIPMPITYRGYFNTVPTHIIKDESALIRAEGSNPAVIVKQRGYNVVKNEYIEESPEMDTDYKYIAVRVKGESGVRFVELPQIKFIDENGELKQVGQGFRGLTFGLAEMRNRPNYSGTNSEFSILLDNNGQMLPLEEIYTDATYKLEPAKISEQNGNKTVEIDAVGGINLDSYRVRTLSVDTTVTSSGVKDELTVSERSIDKFYVEQKTDVNDLRPKQKAYVNYECYQLDETGSGDYLKIRYKGDVADTMVALEFLFLNKTDKESLKEKLAAEKIKMVDLIGKPLYVKPKDESLGLIETEPLSNEEALFGYNERKFLYETAKDEDIASDGKGGTAKDGEMTSGAYLLLKNGNFVKEADVVQPKCYDFCSNQATTVFDAYLIVMDENTDHPKTFVIDKSYKGFNTTTGVVDITIPGVGRISVNKNTLKKLERSKKGITGCDIIQTTSKKGSDVENCSVLRKPKNLSLDLPLTDKKEELEAIIRTLYEQFMRDYKNKQYDIGNQVLIPTEKDGVIKNEFVEYVQNRRYMYSSIVPMVDGATNNLQQYLNMKANEFNFNADGSISGGPKYDAKKGIVQGYSKIGTAAVYALSFTFSAGGALVSLVSPLLLLTAPAALGVAAVAVPLFQTAKKRNIQQNKYEYPNKLEKQNTSIKNDAFERINELVEQVKSKYKKGKEAVSNKLDFCLGKGDEQVFLSQLGVIEQDLILGLTQNKNGGTFRRNGNKGVVNRANAHEFNQYKEVVNSLAEEKKDLEYTEKDLTRELNQLKNSGATAEEIENAERRLNEVKNALETKQAELDNAKQNLIISGTNNETDPEMAEILNRIENAKSFILAKYFRKMDGEWVKEGDALETGIVDLVALLKKADVKEEDKKEIREALVEFVKHTDITVDVKGKKFDYVNSHEKYADKENVNWKKLKQIAAKYGMFADETLGIETVDVEPKHLAVQKPLIKTAEKDEEVERVDEREAEHEVEEEKAAEEEAEFAEKKEKNLTTRGLSALIKRFNSADFKQYFKLIEIDNKSKRKGLVYSEEAKKAISKYITQYEKYKGLLYEKIAELENDADLTEKQTEKLEKLREFRDSSEYLSKSFNNAYGSYSETNKEEGL